jgi:two-component system, OmpR family, alkaline phosphatase synthesis response regulator PhoP
MSTILVVEDDQDISDLLAHYLERAGHAVTRLSSGKDVMPRLRAAAADLVILDLMLPGMDGLLVCQAMRADAATAGIPIIMLTARGEEADRITGLELGADDYVTKPFSPKALVARVKALLRRVDRSRQDTQTSYQYGKLSMDLNRHEVTVQGKDVPLTAKEFGLLEHLLRHPGRVLTREVLLNQVWGYDYFGTTRTVDVHVRRLKQKIPLLDDAIQSVKSLGYKLKDE